MPTTKTLKKQYSTPEGAATQKRVQSLLTYHPHGPVLLWGYGTPYMKPNVTLAYDDVTGDKRLPYADKTFAQIIIVHLLEHAPDPAAVLAEAHRILQGQGQLCVVVPQQEQENSPFADGARFSAAHLKQALAKEFHHVNVQGCRKVVGRWWPQLCPMLLATAHKQQLGGHKISNKIPSMGDVLPKLTPPKPVGACRTRLHTL